MAHTPTPWEINGSAIEGCESPNSVFSEHVCHVDQDNDHARDNARLIVRAVNAFEPMREALRMALLSINSFWPATPPENEMQASEDRAIAATREKLIAALALADKDGEQ